jgi:uncharacterized protein
MVGSGDLPADDANDLADAPVHRQVGALELIVRRNPVVSGILERAPQLQLPSWYLGAGAVTQTVWNVLHGYDPTWGIKDYDLVYFDPDDLSADAERVVERQAGEMLADFGVDVDVTNEARVHLWYPQRFGRSIPPYRSTEDAISTWPATASSIGVRSGDDTFVVCAPFGLRDLFGMVVRPNKAMIDREIYETKASRWAERWPRLTVLPW